MADFSVTSCTFSRSIVVPEDTIDITMTIKNTSGAKITKAGLCLCFTNADRGLSGEGWWAPVVQPETSCSWANSASKTLTWSITPDTIMSQDHVPIISRELWNAVQTRFNKNGGKCENRKNAHFLAGRLYCAQCGSVFMRKTYKDRQGNRNRAWKCKGREAGLCTAPIWKEDDLIERIGDAMGILCNETTMAEVGSLFIGDRIEQTA